MEYESTALQNCIKLCWDTRNHLQKTLTQHCLPLGGEHAREEHVESMMDCIEICQVAADFMTRGSPTHASVCAACANICDVCADSCETFTDDKEMLHCAEMCRTCAKSCRETGQEIIAPPPSPMESDSIMA